MTDAPLGIFEPLHPGCQIVYDVDGQPAVAERARAWLAAGDGAPAPSRLRQAATVMLVSEGKPHYRRLEGLRPGVAPVEEMVPAAPVDVFMLRRASTMPSSPDAVVFPGGGVDERDLGCEVPWAGPDCAAWARVMGCDAATAKGVVVAAAREVFEESGVMLASGPDGALPVDKRGDHWAAERASVSAREASFGECLAARGLVLRSDWLRLRSHWVTPPSERTRYDTYFFLARLPRGQHADGRTSEAVEAAWIAPAEALARLREGRMKLVPPTISNLASLARAHSVDEAFALPFDGHVRPVPRRRGEGAVVMGCEVTAS